VGIAVAPAPVQRVAMATIRVPVAGADAAAAVVLVMAQVNVRSQVLKYLAFQWMSSQALRAHATHCLPARLGARALRTVGRD